MVPLLLFKMCGHRNTVLKLNLYRLPPLKKNVIFQSIGFQKIEAMFTKCNWKITFLGGGEQLAVKN